LKKLLLFLVGAFIAAPTTICSEPLTLHMRTQIEQPPGSDQWQEKIIVQDFDPEKVAFLICDVWDKHWCKTLNARSGKIAHKAAPIVEALRERGVKIIHAPSSCMGYYDKKSIPMPIDSSNCCPCTPTCTGYRAWTRQHPAIKITQDDLISDKIEKIWPFLEKHEIKLVIIIGVHTNMCVLGRSFGIKAMVKHGMPIVLVRDLTDAAYNPKQWPYVSNDEATELMVHWIEKNYCPSIESRDLINK